MTRSEKRILVGIKTRARFEDFLSSWATLRRIETAFEGAGIAPDRSYKRAGTGERRAMIAQYYRALDFTQPRDVQRLLRAYEAIIQDAERRLPDEFDRAAVEADIASLKACLAEDGYGYDGNRITGSTPAAHRVLETQPEGRSISELTRRAIFDHVTLNRISWSGRFGDVEFLQRLYVLDELPSTDRRHATMHGDIAQHRIANDDWPDDWVFSDPRLDLLRCADDVLLRFLCEMVHPMVRPDQKEAEALVATFNEHLAPDGWEIAAGKRISGRPTFAGRRRGSAAVAFPAAHHAPDILTDEYVAELSGKCDERLASGDLDGAVTLGRTLLEAVLGELELRLAGNRGDYKGELGKQFKAVAKVLRMDDQRPDLEERFKDVIRGLVMIANGLASLRNKLSDSHARVRKPAPHHARVVVNAAKTVASFLVESYSVQQAKGLLPRPKGEAKA